MRNSFFKIKTNKNASLGMNEITKNTIQGVHKVRVYFNKIYNFLIVFSIQIICKKDLKEKNRFFVRFY